MRNDFEFHAMSIEFDEKKKMDPSAFDADVLDKKIDEEINNSKEPVVQVKGGMTSITDISGKKSQDLIDQYPVIIFSKSYCPFCNQAKELFAEQGVSFAVVELDIVEGG